MKKVSCSIGAVLDSLHQSATETAPKKVYVRDRVVDAEVEKLFGDMQHSEYGWGGQTLPDPGCSFCHSVYELAAGRLQKKKGTASGRKKMIGGVDC